MLYRFLILVFVISISGGYLHAEEKTAYFICKNQKKVRTLRVRADADGKGCEIVYTKEGVSRVEGNGQYFEGCMKILENIRTNLEKSWWKCKDVTKTSQIIQ